MRAAVGAGVGVFVGVACLALSGCSSVGAREDAAASAALRFEENLRGGQALLGCDGLAPGTREELEETAKSLCPPALEELELPSAGEVRRVDVYGRQARVVLDSDTLFLSSFPDGWKVVAAGCEPHPEPELPYQCDLKGG
ncbi:hypothetical protein [Streptomyces sp. NPDC002994]|uniref:hypothetical protein n=1 Tax=Streptomyces sp. NPDC002994 TaxID=3154441 RepID=UPI0033B80753